MIDVQCIDARRQTELLFMEFPVTIHVGRVDGVEISSVEPEQTFLRQQCARSCAGGRWGNVPQDFHAVVNLRCVGVAFPRPR